MNNDPSSLEAEKPEISPTPVRDWTPWLIFAGTLAFYCWGLGSMALWDNDETTYGQIAREMIRTGDWITLHFRDKPWFCHPPLYYWLVALLYKVLGTTEVAARLPSAVFGAGTVSLMYVWGRMLYSRRAAWMASLALALNFQFYMQSRMALLDSPLHFFLLLAIIGFCAGFRGDRRGYTLMFLASGLACLSKGPYGLVHVPMLIIPFLILSGKARRLLEIPWLWGGLLAAVVGLSWYALEVYLYGEPFVQTVFVYFMLKRMTLKVQGQGGPIWLYLAITLFGLFPWSLFLPPALARLWRSWRDERNDASLLVFLGVLIPFVFFTAATTKLPNYIVFAYYPAALAVGWYIDRMLTEGTPGRLAWPTGFALGMGSLFIAATRFWAEGKHPEFAVETFRVAEGVCAVFALAALYALFLALIPRPGKTSPTLGPFGPLAIGMAGFLLAVTTFLGPLAEEYRPIKPLALVVRDSIRPTDTLAIYGVQGEFSLWYYADHPVVPLASEGELLKLFNSRRKVWAIITRQELDALRSIRKTSFRLVSSHGNAMLVSNDSVEGTN